MGFQKMSNMKLTFRETPEVQEPCPRQKLWKTLNDTKSNGVSKNAQPQTHVLGETPEGQEPSPRKKHASC